MGIWWHDQMGTVMDCLVKINGMLELKLGAPNPDAQSEKQSSKAFAKEPLTPRKSLASFATWADLKAESSGLGKAQTGPSDEDVPDKRSSVASVSLAAYATWSDLKADSSCTGKAHSGGRKSECPSRKGERRTTALF